MKTLGSRRILNCRALLMIALSVGWVAEPLMERIPQVGIEKCGSARTRKVSFYLAK